MGRKGGILCQESWWIVKVTWQHWSVYIYIRSRKVCKFEKEEKEKEKNRISCQGYWLVYHQRFLMIGREVCGLIVDTRIVPLW